MSTLCKVASYHEILSISMVRITDTHEVEFTVSNRTILRVIVAVILAVIFLLLLKRLLLSAHC